MIHHISLGVRDLALAGRFYDAALGALGFRRVFEDDEAIGYGLIDDEDILCLKLRAAAAPPGAGFHLAFEAASRLAVDRFHADALAAGGSCNGAPGLRRDYGEHYYAAFLIDPDGHRLEAVNKAPASASLPPATQATNLREYVELQIRERLAGDPSRFDELWLSVPELTRTLRAFDEYGMHWTRQTFDGYYCVPMDDGRWEVYYQERGSRWPSDRFFDERDAIHFALRSAEIIPRPSLKLDDPEPPRPRWERLFPWACILAGILGSALWKASGG